MKIPMPNLVMDFLKVTGYSPAQLSPMVWRILLGVDSLCKKHNKEIKIDDLSYQYDVRTQTKYMITFRSRNKSTHLIPRADSTIIFWQDKFFFVEKSSLRDWAASITDSFEEKIVHMSADDKKVTPHAAAARLEEFLRIDKIERTFPNCIAALEDDKDKIPLDVKPLAMIPGSVVGRTRSKTPSPSAIFQQIGSSKGKMSVSSDLMSFMDLSHLTMGKGSVFAKSEDTFSPPKKLGSKVASLPPKPDVPITKKRKSEELYHWMSKEYQFADPNDIGDELLQASAPVLKEWEALGLNCADTLKHSLGMLHQAGNVMVAGIRSLAKLEKRNSDLQIELSFANLKVMNMEKKSKEQDSRMDDLLGKLSKSEDQNRLQKAEIEKLMADKEEHDQIIKTNAQFFFQYVRVQTLKNEGAPDGGWDLAVEEHKLAEMNKKGEEDEVSSTPQVEVAKEPVESTEADVDPNVD